MKDKWIKLNQLPTDFWGECFIGWHAVDRYQVETSIIMVRNFSSGVKWYCNSLKDWFEFREDVQYRAIVLEYPKITEEDFK